MQKATKYEKAKLKIAFFVPFYGVCPIMKQSADNLAMIETVALSIFGVAGSSIVPPAHNRKGKAIEQERHG